jgi:hypothetical protein
MIKFKSLSLILLTVFVGCKSNQSTNPANNSTGKPDLLIDTITYTRLPNCYQDYPSGIICGGPRFELTLQIGNVGSSDLSEPFYISYSRSKTNFDSLYCSSTIRVNDPPTFIRTGGNIQVTLVGLIDDSTSQVLFVVNTNNRFFRGVTLPMIDEVSYNNNDYVLNIKW